MIHLVDPATLKVIEMNGATYFQFETDMTFIPLKKNATEFMVFDVERATGKSLNSSTLSMSKSRFSTVTIGRVSDWQNFDVKTNLGDILSEGNTVIGYDLTSMNINGEIANTKALSNVPDVILVRKIYPDRKKNKKRIWKLKHLKKEEEKNFHKNSIQQKEKEYEEFLDDIEENPDLRPHVNLYRNEKVIKELQEKTMDEVDDTIAKETKKKVRVKGNKKAGEVNEEAKEEQVVKVKETPKAGEIPPEIKLEELLNELSLNDKPEEPTVDDDKFVDEFIAKLDRIKIEK